MNMNLVVQGLNLNLYTCKWLVNFENCERFYLKLANVVSCLCPVNNPNHSATDTPYNWCTGIIPVIYVILWFQRIVDMTFGAGGHTKALLDNIPDCHIYTLDRDPLAYKIACDLAQERYIFNVLATFSSKSDLNHIFSVFWILLLLLWIADKAYSNSLTFNSKIVSCPSCSGYCQYYVYHVVGIVSIMSIM